MDTGTGIAVAGVCFVLAVLIRSVLPAPKKREHQEAKTDKD